MSTTLKPELSERNDYWLSKHRYYELKHFCLQYPTWKKVVADLKRQRGYSVKEKIDNGTLSRPVEDIVERTDFFMKRISLIESAAIQTDPTLALYILKGVVEERPYNYLRSVMNIPCSRNTYYEAYRRFFWHLSNSRK